MSRPGAPETTEGRGPHEPVAPARRSLERALLAVLLVTQIVWLLFLGYLVAKGLGPGIAG